jgi:hypothetical protein
MDSHYLFVPNSMAVTKTGFSRHEVVNAAGQPMAKNPKLAKAIDRFTVEPEMKGNRVNRVLLPK